MRVREYSVLFALALIWGASFLFIKIGLEGVPAATLVLMRLAFSVAALAAIAVVRPSLAAGWRSFWRLGLLVGLVNNALPFLLITWGETQIASGVASILNATTPLFTVLLAAVWASPGREPLTMRRGMGVLLGFVGVGVLVGPQALRLIGHGPGYVLGELAVLLAAASYGVGALLSRKYAGASPLVPPLTMQVAALVMSLPVALLWNPPTHFPSLVSIGVAAELGILATTVAYLLFFWLIRHVGATRTSLVTYLLPCTALVYGALFLHEPIYLNAFAGLALVLLGTMLTNGTLGRLFAPRRRRHPAPMTLPAVPASEVLRS